MIPKGQTNLSFYTVELLYPVQSKWECITYVVPGGTELEPQVKTGSWAGRTHSQ